MQTHVSLREYARSRRDRGLSGQSHVAVLKAIRTGRLARGVARDGHGRAVGVYPAAADSEWSRRTDARQQRRPPLSEHPGVEDLLALMRAEFARALRRLDRKLARERT